MKRVLAFLLTGILTITSLNLQVMAEGIMPLNGSLEIDKVVKNAEQSPDSLEYEEDFIGDVNDDGGYEVTEIPVNDDYDYEVNYGYIEVAEEENIESVDVYSEDFIQNNMGNINIPSSYTNESNFPVVRNQNPYGTCWAHSSIALAEQSMIKQGLMDKSNIDYSEKHLAYFTTHSVIDPLGGLEGDVVTISPGRSFMEGGNLIFAEEAFAKWMGAAEETLVPHVNDSKVNVEYAYSAAAHLTDYYNINTEDTDDIKQLIMDNGAVGISYFEDDMYYSESFNSYYCTNPTNTNHAVTIVGWDDDFPASNFKTPAPGKGAWRIRNSWGYSSVPNESHYKYFWISYYDASLADAAYSFVFNYAEQYDNNYQYDGSIRKAVTYGTEDEVTAANVFEAKACCTGEKLGAIAFYVDNTNVEYEVKIYTGLSDGTNPESGTLQETSTTYGTTRYVGYHTVSLNKPVSLSSGELFSVVVTLRKTGCKPGIGVEWTGEQDDWYSSTASAKEGQSFKKGSYGTWSDYGKINNRNIKIKAFTKNVNGEEVIPTDIYIENGTDITINRGEHHQVNASVVPGNATNKIIRYFSSNSSVATVTNNGNIVGTGVGDCVITLKSQAGDVVKTINVHVTGVATYIKMAADMEYFYAGKMCQCTYDTDAPDSLHAIWESSDENIATVDDDGKVTFHRAGNVTIRVTVDGLSDEISQYVYPGIVVPEVVVSDDNVVTISWEEGIDVVGYLILRSDDKSGISNLSEIARIDANPLKHSYTYVDNTYKGTSEDLGLRYAVYGPGDRGGYIRSAASRVNTSVGPVHSITYHIGEGGTNSPDNPIKMRAKDSYVKLSDPIVEDGYTFLGWYSDAEYKTRISYLNSVSSDMDVYANIYKGIVPTSIELTVPDKVTYGSNYEIKAKLLPEGATGKIKWSVDDPSMASIDENGVLTPLKCSRTAVYVIASVEAARVSNYTGFWIYPRNVDFDLSLDDDNNVLINWNYLEEVDYYSIDAYNSSTSTWEEIAKITADNQAECQFVDDRYANITSGQYAYYHVYGYVDDIIWERTAYKNILIYPIFDINYVLSEGGFSSGDNKKKARSGDYIELSEGIPERGYTFKGWYSDSSYRYKITSFTMYSSAKTIYGLFEEKLNTVTLNANDGTIVGSTSKSISIRDGSSVGRLETANRTGYEFLGWYTDKTAGEKVSDDYIPTGDVTLYAHWSPIIYNAVFRGDQAIDSIEFTVESGFVLPNLDLPIGHIFTGYNTLASGKGTHYDTGIRYYLTSDIELYPEIEICDHSTATTTITKATPESDGQVVIKCPRDGYTDTTVIHKVTNISVEGGDYRYNGSAIKPGVEVNDYENEAIDTAYYDVSYDNNINAGTATATVTFKGQYYSGVKVVNFEINKSNIKPVGYPVEVTSMVRTGKKVSDVILPENWTWSDESKNTSLPVSSGSKIKANAIYIGANKANYETSVLETEVTINMTNCDHLGYKTDDNFVVDLAATCLEDGSGHYLCKKCNSIVESGVIISALGHNYGEYVSNGDATCTADGTKTRVCRNDSSHKETVTDVGTKLGHSYTEDIAHIIVDSASDCENSGTGHYVCERCGGIAKSGVTIPALGHNYGAYVSNGDATCTTDGTKTRVCKNNASHKQTVTDVGSKLGHNYGEYVSNGDATCTSDGTKTRVCSNDSSHKETVTDVGTKLGHSYIEDIAHIIVDRAADCVNSGTGHYVCGRCAGIAKSGVIIPAIGHDYGEYVSNGDATCTADGTKTRVCKNNASHKQTVTDVGSKLGHNYGEYVSNGDATCTADGTKTRVCSNDSSHKETVTDVGTKLGHSYTEDIAHIIVDRAADCVNSGTGHYVCERCGGIAKSGVTISALGHDYGEYISNGNATCTADGTKTRVCKNNASHKQTVTDVGSKLGHNYGAYASNGDATCTADGTKTRVCRNDSRHKETVIDAGTKLGHSYIEDMSYILVDMYPSCDNDGIGHYICDRCYSIVVDNVAIPAIGHSWYEYESAGATCESNAMMTKYCLNDASHRETYEIPGTAFGHNWYEYESVSATCESNTVMTKVCYNDASHTETYEIPGTMTGHSWYEYESASATCESNTVMTKVCYYNGSHMETYEIPGTAFGHNWYEYESASATCESNTVMTKACYNDASHTETYEVPGTALGHEWDDGEELGNVKVFTCRRCFDKREEVVPYKSKTKIELKLDNGKLGVTEALVNLETRDATGKEMQLSRNIESLCRTEGNKVIFEKANSMPVVEGFTFKGWMNGNKKVTSIPAKKLNSYNGAVIRAVYTENVYKVQYKIVKPKKAKVFGKTPKQNNVKYSDEIALASGLTATVRGNAKKDIPDTHYVLAGWSLTKNSTKIDFEPGEVVSKLRGKTKKDNKLVLYSVWKLAE